MMVSRRARYDTFNCMETIGDRLRRTREHREYSIRDLAKAAGVGTMTIWRVENGEVEPTRKTVRRLAETLGVDPAWLRSGNEEDDQDTP